MNRYSAKGEKSGWTYVEIPHDLVPSLNLPDKKGFRIKGLIDDVRVEKLSTYPVGEGQFIIAINAQLKKKLCKKEGAMVRISFEKDSSKAPQSHELLQAMEDDTIAMQQFASLRLSHQNYFHRYVVTAKTAATKTGRIVHVINAMYKKQDFGEMIRSLRKK